MTFEDRKREIFFEIVNNISDNSKNWLTEDEIIRQVSTRITRKDAKDIFAYFSMGEIKYLDDERMERHRISDAGKIYWEFLKQESEKIRLEKESIQSVIETNVSVGSTNAATRNLYTNILPDNFENQNKYSNRSLILAAFSVLFIAISAYLQYRDKTARRVEELKQEVQQTRKTLDTLRLSVKDLNYSIESLKKDTVLVKIENRAK